MQVNLKTLSSIPAFNRTFIMLKPVDNYFLQQSEPVKSCMYFLRQYILKHDTEITEKWQYGMPFYYYKTKWCFYLWVHKKLGKPYLGIVEGGKVNHPDLLVEKRVKMKILLIDPGKNIPVSKVKNILTKVISLYK